MPQDKKILNQLLLAKKMSDKEDYVAKYNLMNKLLQERPDEFYVDQDHPDYPGIVHAPTGFRMHLPRQATYGIEKKAATKWEKMLSSLTPKKAVKMMEGITKNRALQDTVTSGRITEIPAMGLSRVLNTTHLLRKFPELIDSAVINELGKTLKKEVKPGYHTELANRASVLRRVLRHPKEERDTILRHLKNSKFGGGKQALSVGVNLREKGNTVFPEFKAQSLGGLRKSRTVLSGKGSGSFGSDGGEGRLWFAPVDRFTAESGMLSTYASPAYSFGDIPAVTFIKSPKNPMPIGAGHVNVDTQFLVGPNNLTTSVLTSKTVPLNPAYFSDSSDVHNLAKLLNERMQKYNVPRNNPILDREQTSLNNWLSKSSATYGIEKKAQAKWRTAENLTKLINQLGLDTYFKAPALSETQAKHAVSVALNDKNADIFLHNKNELSASKFFNSVPGNPIKTSLKDTPVSSRFLFRGLKPKPDGSIPFYEGLHTGSAVTFGSPHYSVAGDYLRKNVADSTYPGLLGIYEKSPLQTYAPDYGIESVLRNKRAPKVNFTDIEKKINVVPTPRHNKGGMPQITLTKNPRLGEKFTYETPITPEHNPFKALLLQNGVGRDEVKLIDINDDKTIKKLVNFFKEQDKYLRRSDRATDGYASVNWLDQNPRINILKDNYPDKFSELIRRRVNKLFFNEDPNHKLHVSGLEKVINELRP